MIETYLLEYFVAFASEGSLLKASERLHVSQPSLTRAMQKLEGELGLSLFDRSANKVSLNSNGKVVLDYAHDILALNTLLLDKAKELKEKESLIRVVMTAPGPMYFFSQFFLSTGGKRYIGKISKEEVCIKEVLEGLSDIAFINSKIEKEGLICRKIMTERLYAVLPEGHFLFGKETVSFKELDGQSFLLGNELGIWDDVVKRKLPNSRFLKIDQQSLGEISLHSSIPSFVTNITAGLKPLEGKIRIPIVDEDAEVSFYVLYKEKNKKLFESLEEAGRQ